MSYEQEQQEQLSSGNSPKRVMELPSSPKRSLIGDFVLAAVALLCFSVFMRWSLPEVAVGGVILIATTAWVIEIVCKHHGFVPVRGKSVVITGCDTARHLANHGVMVFAGCLDSNSKGGQELRSQGSPFLHVLQMDVTNEDQIKECVSEIHEKTNGTGAYGLVNNAGVNFLGDIELTTMKQFADITNVNQLGTVRVTKAFIPNIRENKGRIVNVTSVKGRFALPFNAAYSMTKFAGEAFSDILRLEMQKFGVSVSIIEPGNFGGATGCLDMNRIGNDFKDMWENMSQDCKSLYGYEYIDHHLKEVTAAIPTASFNLIPVLDAITDALFSTKPCARYLVSGSSHWYDIYRLRVFLTPFIPTTLMDSWLLRDISHFPLQHQKIRY